jgi:hypothetical protein
VPPRGINPEVPVYDRAILGFYKQSLVSCSFVLSPPRRTVLVLLLVLDCLHRLASNTIFEALRVLASRTLSGGVSVAPFEYEYHFIEYEYEYERPFLGYSGNLLGNHWFRSLSYSASRYSYSYSYSIACID